MFLSLLTGISIRPSYRTRETISRRLDCMPDLHFYAQSHTMNDNGWKWGESALEIILRWQRSNVEMWNLRRR